jgi:hypothetical protein
MFDPQSKATEPDQNLTGFFALLLEIDRRENPKDYESENA